MTAPGLAAIASRIARIQAFNPIAAPARTTAADFTAALRGALAPADATAATGATGVTGNDVVAAARKYLGVPYVWGGTDPARGLDCSGLVQRAYGDLGVTLPRVSRDQATSGTGVASLDQAGPGDLLAFGRPVHHIAIYLGDGKMIHAPEPGTTVRVQDVYETPSAIRRVLPGAVGGQDAAQAPGRSAYTALFDAATSKYHLPAGLLAAVGAAESGYDPTAVSPAGARGLMQLMPGTAAGLGVDPMDPAQAIDGAGRLLSRHLGTFGSVPLALAAYNAGPGAVQRHGGVPPYPETRQYVRKIMAALGGTA